MRIAVSTLQFGGLQHFPLSREINAAYCRKHGYAFEVRDTDPADKRDRHPIWYKLKRLREILPDHDYVLQMDADAIFVDHQQSVESLVQRMEPEAVMLAGTDRYSEQIVWNDNHVNTGVFVLRNHPTSFALLDYWWDHPGRWRNGWPVEQGAFNNCVREHFSHAVTVIWYRHMNGFDGTFIRHFAGHKYEEKLKFIAEEHGRLLGEGLLPATC
jgi:hypothetical protein